MCLMAKSRRCVLVNLRVYCMTDKVFIQKQEWSGI